MAERARLGSIARHPARPPGSGSDTALSRGSEARSGPAEVQHVDVLSAGNVPARLRAAGAVLAVPGVLAAPFRSPARTLTDGLICGRPARACTSSGGGPVTHDDVGGGGSEMAAMTAASDDGGRGGGGVRPGHG